MTMPDANYPLERSQSESTAWQDGYRQGYAAAELAANVALSKACRAAAYSAAVRAVHDAGVALDVERRHLLRDTTGQCAGDAQRYATKDDAAPLAAAIGAAAGRKLAEHWLANIGATDADIAE